MFFSGKGLGPGFSLSGPKGFQGTGGGAPGAVRFRVFSQRMRMRMTLAIRAVFLSLCVQFFFALNPRKTRCSVKKNLSILDTFSYVILKNSYEYLVKYGAFAKNGFCPTDFFFTKKSLSHAPA